VRLQEYWPSKLVRNHSKLQVEIRSCYYHRFRSLGSLEEVAKNFFCVSPSNLKIRLLLLQLHSSNRILLRLGQSKTFSSKEIFSRQGIRNRFLYPLLLLHLVKEVDPLRSSLGRSLLDYVELMKSSNHEGDERGCLTRARIGSTERGKGKKVR
jgi:hypothetical protein